MFLMKIFLFLVAAVLALMGLIGLCICATNIIQRIFEVGGDYQAAFGWFVAGVTCTYVSAFLIKLIRGDD